MQKTVAKPFADMEIKNWESLSRLKTHILLYIVTIAVLIIDAYTKRVFMMEDGGIPFFGVLLLLNILVKIPVQKPLIKILQVALALIIIGFTGYFIYILTLICLFYGFNSGASVPLYFYVGYIATFMYFAGGFKDGIKATGLGNPYQA